MSDQRARGVEELSARVAELERDNSALEATSRLHQAALEELSRANQMLQLVLEAFPVRVFWKDRDSIFLGCNTLFASDAGKDAPEDLVGEDDFSMGWRDQAELYRSDDRMVIDSGEAKLGYEEPQTTPDGAEIWLRTSKVPLRDAAGETIGVLGTYEDITTRKLAEKAVMVSGARLRALFEQCPFATIIYRPDGSVIDANQAASDMWDLTPEAAAKIHASYNILEDERLIALGVMADIERGFAGAQVTLAPLRYDPPPPPPGTTGALPVRWIQAYLFPISDPDGQLHEVVMMQQDISERRGAEDALRKSERWLATTLSSIGEAVICTDNNGRVAFINPEASALTGWEPDAALGEALTKVFDLGAESGTDPDESPADQVLRRPDDTVRPIAHSRAPILDEDGASLGVVLVFRDVTEERSREVALRQRQRLESLGTLAAGVAHEINNPLTGIMNFGELINRRVQGDATLEKFSAGIVTESERIGDIVRNLLAFSRHDAEAHSPASMAEIIEATLSLSGALLRRDQIELVLDVPVDLPPIKCSSQQIQQVLLNLINNARDALNERYPHHHDDKVLNIRVRAVERDGVGWIDTMVEDHGKGIPDEVLERAFDPFFTTKSRERGTGLGLSVSRGIVDAHRGKLWLDSEVGTGASAHLELRVDNGWNLAGGKGD